MNLILAKIGRYPTLDYAFDEAVRCLKSIDPSLSVEGRYYETLESDLPNVLFLGLTDRIPRAERDSILIDVKNGAGLITGSNERAVLIAVYRFLRELGCQWLHPGPSGERLPTRALAKEDLTVSIAETASYHHRTVCIEGADSYEHIFNMIEWLPRVGMNGYFFQFRIPYTFFARWYHHEGNDTLPKEPLSVEDVSHIKARLVEEIEKRGLMLHAVGHSWTCEPFGIRGIDWSQSQEPIDEETRSCFAMIDGKRGLWHGIGINTNLCYSRSDVRDRVTDAIVSYCRDNPAVSYLHFWLADDSNNHCECEACRAKRPSDWYLTMLNELDAKLTAENLPTRIVFLMYVDTIWPPVETELRHPDRFVLGMAPITRSYSKTFLEEQTAEPKILQPYVRNKLTMPTSVKENLQYLALWQERFRGDSFDFDYHLMWDHVRDPGYYESARVLHSDMANLDKIGLNGMVSCQIQRAAFPTGLPLYAMAAGLWDKTSRFEDVARDYFRSAFGEDGPAVQTYLKTLSALFDPPYLRHEKPTVDPEAAARLAKIPAVVEAFRRTYLTGDLTKDPARRALAYHADYCLILADWLCLRAEGREEAAKKRAEAFRAFLNRTEPALAEIFDPWNAWITLGTM